MEDMHISTDAGNATAAEAKPTGTPPKPQSPIDQTRAIAKKFLAVITGRPKG